MPRRAPRSTRAARWVAVGRHRVSVRKTGDGVLEVVAVKHPKGEKDGCAFEGSLEGFELFHERNSKGVKHQRGPRDVPDVLFQLGDLTGVEYSSDKWDGKRRTYVHHFQRPRPLLCSDHRGRLFILGGRYRITPDGIEG